MKFAILSALLKIMLILFALIAIYGIYLDQQIKQRIDGNVWELPAAVYGQVVELEPDSGLSQKEVISVLDSSQYRQVLKAVRPGEFVVNKDSIELYRRPFEYPDTKEAEFRANFIFNQDRLVRIQNMETGRDFGFFRIDPRLITMMHSVNGELRLFVPLSGFSDLLIQTLLATEDRRFYEHDGVSVLSIGRAFMANLTAGKAVQGGSTLTQQLVKNLFLSNERSFKRKINEALMALILDKRYSKDRILELYLNEVYLGQDGDDEIHGFPLASQYYFGRPVDELSLDQQALLVGMVKGASFYNPWKNPERALERRNVVLALLKKQAFIDDELYDILSQRPLGVLPRGGVLSPQPAFMQLVKQELSSKLGEQANNLKGARIFTTLDPIAQTAAEKSVVDGLKGLRTSKKMPDLEGAMVVVNRLTGEVKALVGGSQPQYAGFNRALLARRSIGSLAKPSTYLAALSQPETYRLNTWIADEPVTIDLGNGKTWSPRNISRQYSGKVMLMDALKRSLNVPTVNLGMALGLDTTASILRQLGVPKEVIKPLPARLLGALNMTPLETAQMFQTIGNMGSQSPVSSLRAVIAENGEVLYRSYPQSYQTVSPQASYLALFALQKVVEQGTARSLQSGFAKYHLAGKTGSTNDFIDSWYAGIDNRDVVITWIGRDNNKPTGLSGSAGALPVYKTFLNNYRPEVFTIPVPEDIHMMNIDSEGRFVCSGGAQKVPVWTANPNGLCRQSETQYRQQTQETQLWNEPSQQNQTQQNQSDAPKWLVDMFSQ